MYGDGMNKQQAEAVVSQLMVSIASTTLAHLTRPTPSQQYLHMRNAQRAFSQYMLAGIVSSLCFATISAD